MTLVERCTARAKLSVAGAKGCVAVASPPPVQSSSTGAKVKCTPSDVSSMAAVPKIGKQKGKHKKTAEE
jgi:hypothetical protein